MNGVALPASRKRTSVIRVAGSIALLVVMALVFPRQKLLAALRSIPLSTLAAVIPIYLLIHVVGCLKWRLIVNRAGASLSFGEAVRCYFAGLFSNIFIPSMIGGDVVMVAMAASRSGKPESVVSGTLASRVLDFGALIVVACFAMFVLPHGPNPTAERLIDLILAIFLGAGVLACILAFLLRRKIPARAQKYWLAFSIIWQRPEFAAGVFALTIGLQTGLIALTAWLGAGCGLVLPLRAWLFAWPLAKLSAMVPITLAGIGTREFVLAALLARFGAEPAAAAGVGLAWDAVFIVGGFIGGAISKSASLFMTATPSPSTAPSRPCTT